MSTESKLLRSPWSAGPKRVASVMLSKMLGTHVLSVATRADNCVHGTSSRRGAAWVGKESIATMNL